MKRKDMKRTALDGDENRPKDDGTNKLQLKKKIKHKNEGFLTRHLLYSTSSKVTFFMKWQLCHIFGTA